MPSAIAEADAFTAVVQRPNNGELADAASLLQGLQPTTNRLRFLYNRMLMGMRDVRLTGADPTGVADSTAAFQAAIDAVHGAGGGWVHVPAGTYKLIASLVIPIDVSLIAPSGAILSKSHVSNSWIELDNVGTYYGAPQLIAGLVFDAAFPTSADAIHMQTYANPRRLLVDGCAYNENSLNAGGAFLVLDTAAATETVVRNCRARQRSNGPSVLLAQGQQSLEIQGGIYRGSATYDLELISVADTLLDMSGARLDCSAVAAGGPKPIVNVSGSGNKNFRGCVFTGASSSISAAIQHAGAGLLTVGDDNIFSGVARYSFGTLPSGSRVALSPPITVTSGGGGPFDLGAVGANHEAISYVVTNDFGGAGPVFTMPPIRYRGQRLTVTVKNASGSITSWTSVSFTGVGGAASGVQADGQVRTWRFIALDADHDGTPVWVLETAPTGTWTGG